MGNLLAPAECQPAAKNESVISISDNCIDRLIQDDVKDKSQSKGEKLLTDEQWMMDLKYKDDIHSINNDLTIFAIEKLMDNIEKRIGIIRTNICSTDRVIACFQKHSTCSINCKRYVDEFIDCINKARIEIIKQKIEEENECRLLEENNLKTEIIKTG